MRKLLSSCQTRLKELSQEALQKIPENSIVGNSFSRWTIGSTVFELDLGREPDIRDWPDAELEYLKQQFKDDEVHVEISDKREIEAAPHTNGSEPTPSKSSQKRNRVENRLRDRLKQTIETAIGRRIHQRSSKAIDPRHSDPEQPNLYAWKFSPEYPRFPSSKKGGISRWSAEQIRYCNEALDNGHLTAVAIEEGSAEQAEIRQQRRRGSAMESDLDDSLQHSHSDQGNQHVNKDQCGQPNSPTSIPSQRRNRDPSPPPNDVDVNESDESLLAQIRETEQIFKEEAKGINDHSKGVHGLMKGLSEMHYRMVNTMFDMVRAKQIQVLEQTLKSKHEMKVNKLHKEIEELEERLRTEQGAKHDAVAMISECQMQIHTLKEQASRDTDELSKQLAAARQDGEEIGRNKAIEDLNAINEGERLALQRSYLNQLDKVKKDSYQQGLEAGRASYNFGSSDIDELKRNHVDELKSAREAGRQEGRDMAYKELALGPEDQITNLVQGHNELNTSRKIRELKTIHQNWGEPPQKALPAWMLPEGHTPGDKTLYFLAKLSKEVDGVRASQLLTEEIDRRCLNFRKDSKNHIVSSIVTNTDIKNVLDAIRPPNGTDASHASSIEPSITPQPSAKQSARKEATSAKPATQIHMSNKTSGFSQVSPAQTSSQAKTTPAIIGSIYRSKKPFEKPQQAHNDTPSRPKTSTLSTSSQPNIDSIERILKSLPSAPRINLPSTLQNFSSKFIQRHIGGAEYTFATVSPEKKDQVVPWRSTIRVNTVIHRYAPRLGVHGALTLVQGKPNNGVLGSIDPVILKVGTDEYSYLGHYKVVSRHTMPVTAWLDEAEETKIRIAKEIADTKWGSQLITKRNIKCDGATLQDRVDQILASFELGDSQPNLRAEWVVLQLTTFKHNEYNFLLAALADDQRLGTGQHVQSVLEATQQSFLEICGKQSLENNPDREGVDFLAAEKNGLTARIVEKGEKDRMFGRCYTTTAELARLKDYIVNMTLHISDSFPLISVSTQEETTKAVNTFYAIFSRHNEKVLEQQKTDRMERYARRQKENNSFRPPGQSSASSSFSSSSASSQKRRRMGGEVQPTKRPKIIPRSSIPQVMLRHWEENADGTLVEEPSGSMIIVDTTRSASPEVKQDENEVEEDLYNATPAPRGRARAKKAGGS
ncbi:hypothetical protein L207DRAFT_590480 [Hyaloscypha variabilis F]|uniref:DUF6697 domain-containing protein n=1 Tax=Hyaloscypha variabilis (strain UAMH 11265 / GT02V1 / F) TaxID=1149755 RepID=A0A2J6R2P2_HYAVF|nr:hypothetical protein L207DRAFT_590480 [Hyaloscypha variabilis F]